MEVDATKDLDNIVDGERYIYENLLSEPVRGKGMVLERVLKTAVYNALLGKGMVGYNKRELDSLGKVKKEGRARKDMRKILKGKFYQKKKKSREGLQGIGYFINELRDRGVEDSPIYNFIIDSRDNFLSNGKSRIKETVFEGPKGPVEVYNAVRKSLKGWVEIWKGNKFF